MILLHRLSHLKYNNQLPKISKIKIITPSELFKGAIKELSQSLELSNIKQLKMTDYYITIIEQYRRSFLKGKGLNILDYKDDNSIESKVIDSYYSYEFVTMIKSRYEEEIDLYKKNISIGKIKKILDKFYQKESYYTKTSNNFYFEELKVIIKDTIARNNEIYKNLHRTLEKIANTIELKHLLSNNKLNYFNYNEINHIIEIMNKRIKSIKYEKSSNQRDKLKEKIISYQDELENKKDTMSFLLNKEEINILERSLEIIQRNENFILLFIDNIIENKRTEYQIISKHKTIGKHELFLTLLVYYLHYGKMKSLDEMIIVDEGQDYSSYEYLLLHKILGDNCIFNIYGDINQCISPNRGIIKWEKINFLDFNKYSLLENYRNTLQITEYTNNKLNFKHTAIGLSGEDVHEINYEKIEDDIKSVIKNNKNERIAIIINDNYLANQLRETIVGSVQFLGNVYEAKGMEFDVVYVFPFGMSENERYIAYTRALSILKIIIFNNKPI